MHRSQLQMNSSRLHMSSSGFQKHYRLGSISPNTSLLAYCQVHVDAPNELALHRLSKGCTPCKDFAPSLSPSSIDIPYSYNRRLNISSIPTCQRTCPPLANPTCQVRWRNAHGLPFNIPTCQKPVCNLILASGSSCGFACQDPFSFLHGLPNCLSTKPRTRCHLSSALRARN